MSVGSVTLPVRGLSDPDHATSSTLTSTQEVGLERVRSNDSQAFQKTLLDQSPAYRSALSKAEAATSAPISLATADEDSPWAKKTILCLDGGGIRGYSSLLILKCLMKHIKEREQEHDSRTRASWNSLLLESDGVKADEHPEFLPCHYFDYIAGTSSGGLIAIMLGRLRMSVDAVLKEYITVYRQGLSRHFSRPVTKIVDHIRKRSSTGYESEMRNVVKAAQSSPDETNQVFRSDATRCRTIVCSVRKGANKAFSIPYFYRSYPISMDSDQSSLRGTDLGATPDILAVAQATFAAPKLSRSTYLNASLNNPSFEVHEEVRRLHKQFTDPICLFLSLGCGNPKSKSSQARKAQKTGSGGIPPSKLEIQLRMVSDAVHEIMLSQSNRGRLFDYYRLDVKERLDTVRLDEWKPKESGNDTINRIKVATEEYLQDRDVVEILENCAEELVSKRRNRSETMRWEAFALGTRYRCKVDPPCDLKDTGGKPIVFQDRNGLLDHLRIYHKMPPPDSKNFEEIKNLLDKGRTNSDSMYDSAS